MKGKSENRQRGGNAHGGGDGKQANKTNGHLNSNSSNLNRQQPVYSADGTRVIGTVDGYTFTTTRKTSKHQLRKPPAWAIDRVALQRLAAQGVTTIVIEDTEGHLIYTANVADFVTHGFAFNRGFGAQVGLKLGYFSVEVAGSERFEEAAQAVQLSLFGEGV